MRTEIIDANRGAIPPRVTRYTVGRARVERCPGALRLVIEDAPADVLADAQIDDYHASGREALRWGPPLRLRVRARWSHAADALRGTTGFGLWNDPLDERGRFAASPSYLWFFHASAPSRMRLQGGADGEGFVAAALAGPEVRRATIAAGNLALRVPGVERLATRLGERRAQTGDVRLPADLDLMVWHDYALDWAETAAVFAIDGSFVATLPGSALPRRRLGFVAWIDNNWLAPDATGRYRGGRVAVPGIQWLEIAHIELGR